MTRFVIGNVGVFPFSGSAQVTGNLQVSGAGHHPGAVLEVMGPATGPGLRVTGNAEITGDLTVKGTTAVDFRADNALNFDSLEKNSVDLYASFKSLYLQNRENKINNSSENEDDWGSLDK